MGPMAIRARLARTDEHLTALLAVLVVAGAVVGHHAVPNPVGALHGEHPAAAAATCLGALASTIVIVGLAGRAARRWRPHPGRPFRVLVPTVARVVLLSPSPSPRSTPLYLRFAVLRR